jgi:hypothetical protein
LASFDLALTPPSLYSTPFFPALFPLSLTPPCSFQLADYSSDLDPLSSPVTSKKSKHALSTPLSSMLNAKRKRQASSITPQKKHRNTAPAKKTGGGVGVGETRTTRYECIGVVKVKVVFGKRYVVLSSLASFRSAG